MKRREPGVGSVCRIAGPVVESEGLVEARLNDVVRVGPLSLIGELIRLEGSRAVLQVYEDTAGLRVGDGVVATGAPLEVELGPGLLGTIYDGIQRPLAACAAQGDDPFAQPHLERGVALPALSRERIWEFEPRVEEGDEVAAGDLLGTVQETQALVHRVLVPPGQAGRVTRVRSGPTRVDEPVVWLDELPLGLLQRWPVRQGRPFVRRLDPDTPLVTGQRVVDVLFPVARGGTAVIPGGFGTGKTVLEQTLAKWSEVDVIVYIGCGERGNELTEILEDFAQQRDPRNGAPLLERTICIANTSNMPIAAREASIYTGLTIAEYYRDQGYDVALMADSTSRWGEALREISGRLEEMPGQEGYPAYLQARLAGFYERAGSVECLGSDERQGTVSIVGAVSPPGGDFSEPITQESLRLGGTFWSLDTDLARRRHFPAIHWTRSYSLYDLSRWFSRNVAADWEDLRRWALALLQEEDELLAVVQLLGIDALAPAQRVLLDTGRRLREDFLQQSAVDEQDAFCPLSKQYWMLELLHRVHQATRDAVARGLGIEALLALGPLQELSRIRTWPFEEAQERAGELAERVEKGLEGLLRERTP